MHQTTHGKTKACVTNVSNEAAWLLVLQELADSWPSFVLQVTEVGGCAFIHIMHMLLLQLGSFRIHPRESRPTQGRQVRE